MVNNGKKTAKHIHPKRYNSNIIMDNGIPRQTDSRKGVKFNSESSEDKQMALSNARSQERKVDTGANCAIWSTQNITTKR